MKNIIKKNKKSIDAIAEARKFKAFQELSKDTDARLRLAVEVYNQREKLGLSQQDLAKKIGSTQKVISKIENGDVNAGFDLVARIGNALSFTANNWSQVYKFTMPGVKIIWGLVAKDSASEPLAEHKETRGVNTTSLISLINNN